MLPILFLSVTITAVHGDISCYDDSGKPVGWCVQDTPFLSSATFYFLLATLRQLEFLFILFLSQVYTPAALIWIGVSMVLLF